MSDSYPSAGRKGPRQPRISVARLRRAIAAVQETEVDRILSATQNVIDMMRSTALVHGVPDNCILGAAAVGASSLFDGIGRRLLRQAMQLYPPDTASVSTPPQDEVTNPYRPTGRRSESSGSSKLDLHASASGNGIGEAEASESMFTTVTGLERFSIDDVYRSHDASADAGISARVGSRSS